MSKRSQEKRRARSKEKMKEKRRMQGMSPFSRLVGRAEETCECWMLYSDDRVFGLTVMRPAFGGEMVGAFMEVDRDCIGLRQAYCLTDINPGAVREQVREGSKQEGARAVKVGVEEVRKIVAGGIRWTRAHPYFRMPAEWERCVKVLDGVGDLESADVSMFGTEDGGLFYLGLEEDLESRLVGMSVDEFMEMEGVECEFEDDNWDLEEPLGELSEGEEMEADAPAMEFLETMYRTIIKHVQEWCVKTGKTPAKGLEWGAKTYVGIMTVSAIAEAAGRTPEEVEESRRGIIDLMSDDAPDDLSEEEALAGVMQVSECVRETGADFAKMAQEAILGRGATDPEMDDSNTLTVEPRCSTHDIPSLPNSSLDTPVP